MSRPYGRTRAGLKAASPGGRFAVGPLQANVMAGRGGRDAIAITITAFSPTVALAAALGPLIEVPAACRVVSKPLA